MSSQQKKSGVSGSSPSSGSTSQKASSNTTQRTVATTKAEEQKLRSERIKGGRAEAQKKYEKNKREMQIIRIVGTVLVVAIVGAIGWGIWSWAGDKTNNAAPSKTVADYTYAGSQHSNDPQTYSESPPVGGIHNPVWQNCAYYAAPINSENGVHALEHGAVWITYSPDLPQDQIDKLKSIAEGQDYILVSPYPGLSSPVVASSWNHQIKLDGANDADLTRFIKKYKQGPDTPEPGASCSGGTSATAAGA
jgi:hypothetical protein